MAYGTEDQIGNNTLSSFINKGCFTDITTEMKCTFSKIVSDSSRDKKINYWHDGLFVKMANYGITNNFLYLIRDIYKKTNCAVKIGDRTTNFF